MDMVINKICTKCKTSKPLSCFTLKRKGSDERRSVCKICTWEMEKLRRKEHPEKIIASVKKYAKAHPERVKAVKKKWDQKNKDYVLEQTKIWRSSHLNQARATQRKNYALNKDKIRKYQKDMREKYPEREREWRRNRYSKIRSTAIGRLTLNIRGSISTSLRRNKNGQHWEGLIEFTINKLKKHLEKKFTPEMTWENYGSYWEVDHIIPIAVFNYTTAQDIDFKRCWSLSNLQPLECSKNRSKQAKIYKPFQPSLAMAI